jgi:hypothetical protein
MLVEDKERVLNEESSKKLEGMEPVSRLEVKLRTCNLTKLLKATGRGPTRELELRSIDMRLVAAERVDGMLPVKRLR